MLGYPATSFVNFYSNHGLLRVRNRPQWRTVSGGSRAYVERLTASYHDRIKRGVAARRVRRNGDRVGIWDSAGRVEWFDHVVIAAHADQALAMLDDRSVAETEILGAFRYSKNTAILHGDTSLMPRRRAAWSSWNYIGPASPGKAASGCTLTYWMNRLQNIAPDTPLFVTLNPQRMPAAGTIVSAQVYEHPLFDAAAIRAQRQLWSLQGGSNTWFCGAYFGAGFHEDGLQAGLAVAEALGGMRRPWTVANESGRIIRRAAADGAHRAGRRMTKSSALFVGAVIHRRLQPRRHYLRHSAFWLLLDLDEIDALHSRLRLFSRGRFNAVSFHDTDHGEQTCEPLRAQVERHLASAGVIWMAALSGSSACHAFSATASIR